MKEILLNMPELIIKECKLDLPIEECGADFNERACEETCPGYSECKRRTETREMIDRLNEKNNSLN
ncbi:hypothetical protein [Vallitalea okinawensis]|uniref:hypothetical protein n=1 Tax=Vallitalea okinawensis TaxID=2078660 RepID=UPI000CFB663D|nr:hypothetical protein [Vallitalea okinawensis]